MLALTLRPGEYVDIGDNVRFVFTGGSENNIHVLVDAPKDLVIFRSAAPPGVMKPTKAEKTKKKAKPKNSQGKKTQAPHRGGEADESLETRIRRIFEGY